MKRIFAKTRDLAERKLRGLCAGLSPKKRVMTVVVLASLFAVGNFYMIFRAIYDIGREDARQEVIEIDFWKSRTLFRQTRFRTGESVRWKSF